MLPNVIAEVDNLQLVDGLLGMSLPGSHLSLLIEGGDPCIHRTDIQVHYTVSQISDNIKQYFETEGLGTTPLLSQCSSCKTAVTPDATLDELKELEDIRKGLTHDPINQNWTVRYPWVKDERELPNIFPGALGQLKALEKHLLKSGAESDIEIHYKQFTDMVDRGAIWKLTEAELSSYQGSLFPSPRS